MSQMPGREAAQHGNRLDPWFDHYAERAHNLRASEIRALFSVVSRPEVVSLAGGMPNLKDLPIERLADSARDLIARNGSVAMQYGSGQGWEPLREQICDVMSYDGIAGADPMTLSSPPVRSRPWTLFPNCSLTRVTLSSRSRRHMWEPLVCFVRVRPMWCTSTWMPMASFRRRWRI